MATNLRSVLVVDVEATCWDHEAHDPAERQGERPNEIIEIGVALLDLAQGKVEQRASIVVKPRFTTVSAFCARLTGWTQDRVAAEGVDIVEAFAAAKKIFAISRDHVWFSYGDYDRKKLSSLTGAGGVGGLYGIKPEDNPFDRMRGHFNIKTLMALKHRLPRELGMDEALAFYGEKLEGRHHHGGDDAFNIAKIVRRVLQPGA
jgi:inhibitor of KinA sporulation pathway (predicted exonuclease)